MDAPIRLEDVRRAWEARDPETVALVVDLTRQDDPTPETPIRAGAPTFASYLAEIRSRDFRRKPLEKVLPAAQAAGIAIIARVPLASGLLSGKYTHSSTFGADDHRSYNRHGEAFDAGETFSGVDYDTGVDAAQEFAAIAPAGASTAQAALRWVIQQPGVTTVIPGARSPDQARQNAAAAALPPLTEAELGAIGNLYDRRIRALVHDRW